MKKRILKFVMSEHGATAIEYGLILALAVLAVVGSISTLGAAVTNLLYNQIAAAL